MHIGPNEAHMMSAVINKEDKSPLASLSVVVSSLETEICLLVSVCVFVHNSCLTVNYVIPIGLPILLSDG